MAVLRFDQIISRLDTGYGTEDRLSDSEWFDAAIGRQHEFGVDFDTRSDSQPTIVVGREASTQYATSFVEMEYYWQKCIELLKQAGAIDRDPRQGESQPAPRVFEVTNVSARTNLLERGRLDVDERGGDVYEKTKGIYFEDGQGQRVGPAEFTPSSDEILFNALAASGASFLDESDPTDRREQFLEFSDSDLFGREFKTAEFLPEEFLTDSGDVDLRACAARSLSKFSYDESRETFVYKADSPSDPETLVHSVGIPRELADNLTVRVYSDGESIVEDAGSRRQALWAVWSVLTDLRWSLNDNNSIKKN